MRRKEDDFAKLKRIVKEQHDRQIARVMKALEIDRFIVLAHLARDRYDFGVPIFEDVRKKARAIPRDKCNYDWETGDWINKGFIYHLDKEGLVKTSRKRKNK